MRGGSLRRGRLLTIPALCLGASLAAQAQVGVTFGADSDYRFRGVSPNESRPSLRAALNYDAANGCYGGASGTRVELERGDRYAQVLGYAGCTLPVGPGKHVEAGASYSHFTGDSSYDFAEVYLGLLAQGWSARLHVSPDYFGRHVSTVYAELDVHTLIDENLRLFAHLGAIVRSGGDGGGASRTRGDIRLGAGWSRHGLDLQLAWVGAGRGGPYPAVYTGSRGGWVAGVSYSF